MGVVLDRLRRMQGKVKGRLHRPPAGVRLVHVPPSYTVVDQLNAESIVVDLGLGFDADFSMGLIERYGLKSFGFDPTRRHAPGLQKLAEESNGRFGFFPNAIGEARGTLTFHESKENVSGSLVNDHLNVLHDTVEDYDVDVITLADAIDIAGGEVDLVKMDIEGSEVAVLDSIDDSVLRQVDQWCIEFHHAQVSGIRFSDTARHIGRLCRLGFHEFTRDNRDFLFYRAATGAS